MQNRRRNTPQRMIVLEAVMARHDHPCADDIYNDVIKRRPRISRGTVYRNLNILAEDGEIRHVKIHMGADRFDSRLEPHYHAHCLECGKVIDIDFPYSAELDHEAEEMTGYAIDVHRVVFEGLCPKCLQAQEKKNSDVNTTMRANVIRPVYAHTALK